MLQKETSYLKWKQRLLIVNTHKDFSHNQFFAENGESESSTKGSVTFTLEK